MHKRGDRMKELIEKVKAYALAHYEDGWHWVYETHDYKDYKEELEDQGIYRFDLAIEYYQRMVDYTVEQEQDICGSEW